MADGVSIRRLTLADLPAYKALRDQSLADDPTAFTSDAADVAPKPALAYAGRLGLERADGGHFTLGAFDAAGRLLGAVSCDRETRAKIRHSAHVVGMMVSRDARRRGIGRRLLEQCIADARRANGLELLTLSVTAGNPAERLYASVGFVRYGTLRRAIKLGTDHFDKTLMSLDL